MNKKRLGVALCGSYCTYGKLFPALEGLAEEYELVPIMSDTAAETDSRFGTAAEHLSISCACLPCLLPLLWARRQSVLTK